MNAKLRHDFFIQNSVLYSVAQTVLKLDKVMILDQTSSLVRLHVKCFECNL